MRRETSDESSRIEVESSNLVDDIDGIEIVGLDETENYRPEFHRSPVQNPNPSNFNAPNSENQISSSPSNATSTTNLQESTVPSDIPQETSTVSSNKQLDNEKQQKEKESPAIQEEDPKDTFNCNICFDPPEDPVVTVCGHLFCWRCLYQWMNNTTTQNLNCPVCKAGLQRDKIIPLYGRGKSAKSIPKSENHSDCNHQTDPSHPSSSTEVPPRPQGERPPPPQNPNYAPQQNPFFFGQQNPFFFGGGGFGPFSQHSFSTEIRFGQNIGNPFSFPFMGFNLRTETVGGDGRRVTTINTQQGNFFSRLFILFGILTLLAIIFL